MDIRRVQEDLRILQDLKLQGAIRDIDWNPNLDDPWIIIFGAFQLPPKRFNLPDCNLKVPLPSRLYEPVRGQENRFHFYHTIFMDARLRERALGRWKPIRRQFLYQKQEAEKGWAFLCVYPKPVGTDADIRTLLPVVQRFLFHPR